MGFWCLQDLHTQKPCPHPGRSVWTNSPCPIFLYPCFGILTHFYRLFTINFIHHRLFWFDWLPHTYLWTWPVPLIWTYIFFLLVFFPLLLTSPTMCPHHTPNFFFFYLPIYIYIYIFLYRNIAIPQVEMHQNQVCAVPNFWFFGYLSSCPSQKPPLQTSISPGANGNISGD